MPEKKGKSAVKSPATPAKGSSPITAPGGTPPRAPTPLVKPDKWWLPPAPKAPAPVVRAPVGRVPFVVPPVQRPGGGGQPSQQPQAQASSFAQEFSVPEADYGPTLPPPPPMIGVSWGNQPSRYPGIPTPQATVAALGDLRKTPVGRAPSLMPPSAKGAGLDARGLVGAAAFAASPLLAGTAKAIYEAATMPAQDSPEGKFEDIATGRTAFRALGQSVVEAGKATTESAQTSTAAQIANALQGKPVENLTYNAIKELIDKPATPENLNTIKEAGLQDLANMTSDKLSRAGRIIAPLGELWMETSGRGYGGVRLFGEDFAKNKDALYEQAKAKGLDYFAASKLIGQWAITGSVPDGYSLPTPRNKGLTNLKEYAVAGRKAFEDLHPVEQFAVSIVLAPVDPIQILADISPLGLAAQRTRMAREAVEFSSVKTAMTIEDVVAAGKTGVLFPSDPVSKLVEYIPWFGKRTTAATPKITGETTLQFAGNLWNGRTAEEQVQLTKMLAQFARGDVRWVEIANRFGLGPRAPTAQEISTGLYKAGDIISPLETKAGKLTAALMDKILTVTGEGKRAGQASMEKAVNLSKILETIQKGYEPIATTADKVASNEAAAALLNKFVTASRDLYEIKPAVGGKAAVEGVYKSWMQIQAHYAIAQMFSIGRSVRDTFTSFTDAIASRALSLDFVGLRGQWSSAVGVRGQPFGAVRGEISGTMKGLEVRPALLEKVLGGTPIKDWQAALRTKGALGELAAGVIGGPSGIATVKEDMIRQIPFYKGVDWTRRMLGGSKIIPEANVTALRAAAGEDLAARLIGSFDGVINQGQINAIEQAALKGEAWRLIKPEFAGPFSTWGWSDDANRMAQAATASDFKLAWSEFVSNKQTAVAGFEPVIGFKQDIERLIAYGRSKGYDASRAEDVAKDLIGFRAKYQEAKIISESVARHSIADIPDTAKQAKWLEEANALTRKWSAAASDVAMEGTRQLEMDYFMGEITEKQYRLSSGELWQKLFQDEQDSWVDFYNRLNADLPIGKKIETAAVDAMTGRTTPPVAQAAEAVTPPTVAIPPKTVIPDTVSPPKAPTSLPNYVPPKPPKYGVLSGITEPSSFPPDPTVASKVLWPNQYRTLKAWRDDVLKNWGAVYGDLTPEAVKEIKNTFSAARTGLNSWRQVAESIGTAYADYVYHGYGVDERNFDTILRTMYGYPFWYVREGFKWMRHIVDNPHMVWALQNFRNAIEKQNEGFSADMKQNINKYLGSAGLLSFPIFSQFDPTYNYTGPNYHNPLIEGDEVGKYYYTLTDFGPGSAHPAIPMVFALAAAAAEKDDLAYAYANRISSATTLMQSAAEYLPEDIKNNPLLPGLAPEGVLRWLPGYDQMYVKTDKGTSFVGTNTDRRDMARQISQMVAKQEISNEMAQQIYFVADHLFDDRYRNNPDYVEAYKWLREAISRNNKSKLWTTLDESQLELDPNNPDEAATLEWLRNMQQTVGGIPGPTLLSFLGGPALKYKTDTELKIRASQETYAAIRAQKENLYAQGEAGQDKYRELQSEYFNDPENSLYSTYLFAGKHGTQMDEAYAWSVLSRLGTGRLDNPAIKASGMNDALLSEFYTSGGIPDSWSNRGSYDYDSFMNSIVVMGSMLALPDYETTKDWSDSRKAYGTKVADALAIEFPEEVLANYDLYKFGDVPKGYLANHPEFLPVIQREAELIMSDPVVASHYASESTVETYLRTRFDKSHADTKGVYDQYIEIGRLDDKAQDAFYKKNKEAVDAYRSDLRAFKAGLAGEVDKMLADIAKKHPVDLPSLRDDIEPNALANIQKDLKAAEEKLFQDEKLRAEEVRQAMGTDGELPATDASQFATQYVSRFRAEDAVENKRLGYLTDDNRDTYEATLYDTVLARQNYDPKKAMESFYTVASEGWPVYQTMDTPQELLAFKGDSLHLREKIMTDTTNKWAQVVAYVRTLTPDQLKQLKGEIPDIEWVYAHAQRWDDGPSEAARADIVGLNVSFPPDGTVSISRMSTKEYESGTSNPGTGKAPSGGGSGGKKKKSTEGIDWNKYYGGEGPALPGHPRDTGRNYSGGYGGRDGNGQDGGYAPRPARQPYVDPQAAEGAALMAEWDAFAGTLAARPDLLVRIQDYLSANETSAQQMLAQFPELALIISKMSPEQLARLKKAWLVWALQNGRIGSTQAVRYGVAMPELGPTLRYYSRRSGRSGLQG